jgi:hypothetical protein
MRFNSFARFHERVYLNASDLRGRSSGPPQETGVPGCSLWQIQTVVAWVVQPLWRHQLRGLAQYLATLVKAGKSFEPTAI